VNHAEGEEENVNTSLHHDSVSETQSVDLDRDFEAAVSDSLAVAVELVARYAEATATRPDKARFHRVLDKVWEKVLDGEYIHGASVARYGGLPSFSSP
jgi:hypothetical protein